VLTSADGTSRRFAAAQLSVAFWGQSRHRRMGSELSLLTDAVEKVGISVGVVLSGIFDPTSLAGCWISSGLD